MPAEDTGHARDQEQRRAPVGEPSHPQLERPLAARLLAETLGTFALTFVATAGAIVAKKTPGAVAEAGVVASGLTVLAMIYAFGDISGAHINPAVTLAFFARRAFPARRVPGYVAAQLVGGVAGAAAAAWLLGASASLGMTRPQMGVAAAFGFEAVLTFFLVLVIIATATDNKLVGHNSGLAVGFVVVLDGLIGVHVSGGSMNPARSLGPAIVSGHFAGQWVYVVAPILGAMLAVGAIRLTHGPPRAEDVEAAEGSA